MADSQENKSAPLQAVVGLNTENTSLNPQSGSLSFALNAAIESFNGEAITYQNDAGNIFNNGFPEGFKVIGQKRIEEQNITLFWLTNNTDSVIGKLINDSFEIVIDDRLSDHKFNFNTSFSIKKSVVKSTNCSTQIYWTDGINPRRFIDLDALPWKETPNPNNDYKPIQQTGILDANKLQVQPNFSIPQIKEIEVINGGNLKKGKYQFAIQYSNGRGEGYTSVYSVTNGADIHEIQPNSTPDARTSKAISIKITNLDTTGVWDYFNLIVIENVNNISTPKLVLTQPISSKEFNYTYSGVESSLIPLDPIELFQDFSYYDTAKDVTEVDGVLIWDQLTKYEEQNFQPIWSKVKLYWETYQLPYNEFEGYKNGVNSALYRGYMRDEVYTFEGRFVTKSGRRLNSFPLVGRSPSSDDLEIISNNDSEAILKNPCDVPEGKAKWQVYNTASVIDFSAEYKNKSIFDDCYVGPYQYGEFAHWQSTDLYPNNPDIWGDLAGKPIRHFKFPDSLITHIHNSTDNPFEDQFIYPIGVKIDVPSLYNALQASSLPQEVKDDIVGYEISRGNRATNKSIIAKGIFSNVGKYATKDRKGNIIDEAFYPNYPFNDVRPDPFYSNRELPNHAGFSPSYMLNGFGSHSKSRFTFHSPDTHFSSPSIPVGGQVKFETIEYGVAKSHFVPVKDNAQYKFLARETALAAAGIAAASSMTLGAGTFGSPTVSLQASIPAYLSAKELFEKIVPTTNFGYSFNSVGYFHKYIPIQNSGNKNRFINHITKLTDGENGVEDGKILNNFRRESSIYINTDREIPYTHQLGAPQDTSRYNLSQINASSLTFKDFYDKFNQEGADYIPDDIISYQISLWQNSKDGNRKVLFNVDNIPISTIPEDGDIYTLGNDSFMVEQVEILPINSTNANIKITASVINNPSSLSLPQQATLSLTYNNTSNSSSASSLTYSSVTVYAANIGSYTAADIEFTLDALESAQYPPDKFEELYSNAKDPIGQLIWLIFQAAYIQRYSENFEPESPEKIRENSTSVFYGSIKANLPNQWGRINSYETISTGYTQSLYNQDGSLKTNIPTIFGGDIFINRFAYKTKLPFYRSNTHNTNDQTDIEYDKKGTLTWPMFWLSTKPEQLEVDLDKEIEAVLKLIENSPGVKGDGTTIAKIWTTIKGLISGGFANMPVVLNLVLKLFREIVRTVGVPNINLDNYKKDGIIETGIHYLFSYGIVYHFVESQVNTDFRDATNLTDGNFYPNVSKGIPDDWVQESNTPIIYDNSYNYNPTYSLQPKQVFYSHLKEDYDPNKLCNTEFPNRAIWAEQSSLEETKNHWLIYRPTSYYDFPKSYGSLVSLDGLENKQVLARFENRSQLYNALTTVQISQGPSAYLGNNQLFSSPPLDLAATDGGYAGSQHTLLLRTPFGHIFTDSKRGQIILYKPGGGIEDLSLKGMDKWFKTHFPFQISKYFDIPTDNSYNSLGITGVYDALLKRVIITKKDAIPIVTGISYINDEFKYEGNTISVTNSSYFCNKSWSISYSFLTNSWISLHSFIPDYYIQHPTFFQTGYNQSIWNHNKTFSIFNNYYGDIHPYILEYPVSTGVEEYLQNIVDYTSAIQFTDEQISYESNDLIYFNKATLYNRTQNTGLLNLVPRKQNSLAAFRNSIKYNTLSKDIPVDKKDHYYKFNTFWNIVKDDNIPSWIADCSPIIDKELNDSNLDYSRKDFKKELLRNRDLKIRLILDNRDTHRLISRFIIPNSSPSFL